MINEQNNNSPPVNEHFKLQIKTLQNAPRDPDKLEQLLRLKEREKTSGEMDRERQQNAGSGRPVQPPPTKPFHKLVFVVVY
jgi:hypothetical protein